MQMDLVRYGDGKIDEGLEAGADTKEPLKNCSHPRDRKNHTLSEESIDSGKTDQWIGAGRVVAETVPGLWETEREESLRGQGKAMQTRQDWPAMPDCEYLELSGSSF